MILVINPNPALDRVAVTHFQRGATLRPQRFSLWAGGSGTHAGFVAHQLGAQVRVLGFLGGHTGAQFLDRLRAQGLAGSFIEVGGETRQTFSLLDVNEGNICDVAETGPAVSGNQVEHFLALVTQQLPNARLAILSGSLPPGCPATLAADLLAAAHRAGVPCLADLAGADLLLPALSARPWLLKPSRTELATLGGVSQDDLAGLAAVARCWLAEGAEQVCLSLDREGLLWLAPSGTRHFLPPQVEAFNSIGCGDALVGGLAAGYLQTGDLECAMRWGMAAAAANLQYDAPGYCTPADLQRLLPQVRETSWEGN